MTKTHKMPTRPIAEAVREVAQDLRRGSPLTLGSLLSVVAYPLCTEYDEVQDPDGRSYNIYRFADGSSLRV